MRSTNQRQEYSKFVTIKYLSSTLTLIVSINMVAKNMAVGCYFIPGELYKDVKIKE